MRGRSRESVGHGREATEAVRAAAIDPTMRPGPSLRIRRSGRRVRRCTHNAAMSLPDETVEGQMGSNYKSSLQQMAQRQFGATPTYLMLDEKGPDHSKCFKMAAQIGSRRYPAASAPWAALAERALAAGEHVAAYAYARTGYHRGLDALRRSGWKGYGPIPWDHEPNRGFLRALGALAQTAAAIGEQDEAERCRAFLADSDQQAAAALDE